MKQETYYSLKPNFKSSVLFSIYAKAGIFVLCILLGLIATILTPLLLFIIIPILFVLFLALAFFAILDYVVYTKTEYQFYADRIIVYTGNLLSSTQNELLYKNVTYITETKPYFRHMFYGISHVHVESSGSSDISISLLHIDAQEHLFGKIQQSLSKNGYSMSGEKVAQYRPSNVGIFLELVTETVVKIFSITLFIFIFGLANYLPTLLSGKLLSTIILVFASGSILLYLLISTTISYLDKRVRTYTIHSDYVTYYNGFFTKVLAIMPAQNIANTQHTQSILQRIFSIGSVVISCQGSNSHIDFTNIRETQKALAQIDTVAQKQGKNATTPKQTITKLAFKNANTSAPSQYKMHLPRVIASVIKNTLLFLLLLSIIGYFVYRAIQNETIEISQIGIIPLAVAGIFIASFLFKEVSKIIRALKTRYEFSDFLVGEKFAFISKSETEFTTPKIMSITTSQTILDRWYNTTTVAFHSIGSSSNITFLHIHNDSDILERIMQFYHKPTSSDTRSANISLREAFLFRAPYGLIALVVSTLIAVGLHFLTLPYNGIAVYIPVAIGLSVLLYLIMSVWLYAAYTNATISINKNTFNYNYGFFTKISEYTRFSSIKKIQESKNIFLKTTVFHLHIASEVLIKSNNKDQEMYLPTRIRILSPRQNIIDTVKKQLSIKTDDSIITSIKPLSRSIIEKMVPVFFFFIIPFLWPILIPIVLYGLVYIKFITYKLTHSYISKEFGIIVRKCEYVPTHKIDYIEQHQGAIQKILDTTTISVYTKGTSGVDLYVSGIPKETSIYSEIKRTYTAKQNERD